MRNDAILGRRPLGSETAGAHQEGRNSGQAGPTQRRAPSQPEKSRPKAIKKKK
jgi:hypothetical protein